MPRADSLSAAIKGQFSADVELVPSSGGVFEVYRDEQLLFSKKKLGRFPENAEILTLLKKG